MFRLVYEDKYFMAIDKLVPVPCLRHEESGGLSDELIIEFPYLSSIPDYGFTHRLDNETMGIVIVAKDKKYYVKVRELFSLKEVKKIYHARVSGAMEDDYGTVDYPIAHSRKSSKRMIAVKPGYRIYRGRPRKARTEWNLISRGAGVSDLELITNSGIRHQIRVHLNSIGHPICGDALYNPHSEQYPILMLLAKEVSFTCPIRRKEIRLTSTLTLDRMLSEFS